MLYQLIKRLAAARQACFLTDVGADGAGPAYGLLRVRCASKAAGTGKVTALSWPTCPSSPSPFRRTAKS